MNHRLILLLFPVFLGSLACSDNSDPDDYGSGNPATAPVDYLGTINQGKNKAVTDAALLQVNSALAQYKASNLKPAANLQQLIDAGLLAALPELPAGAQWQYDTQNGTVTVIPAK